MTTTICLKLTTGEDLIARRTEEVILQEDLTLADQPIGGHYSLEEVHIIQLQQVAPNQIGLTLIPYLLGDRTAKITIDAAHVIASYKPSKDLEDGFLQKTSSIQIAKSVPNTRIQL